MKNLLIITKYTFLEVYRSKLLVGVLFLAIGLMLVSYVASEFAYGATAKVTLDVGMGVLSLANIIIAIFIGSTLLSKEIEQKTLYMILSKPISRGSFLIGKIWGLSSVLLLNSFVLGLVTIGLYLYRDGAFSSLFIWSILFSFFEALIVLLFAVLFSLVTNTTLAVVYTISIFIVGHAINETSKILFAKLSRTFNTIIDAGFLVLPNFYKLNIKDFLIYEQTLSWSYLLGTLAYAIFYSLAAMCLVTFIFKNKNLD